MEAFDTSVHLDQVRYEGIEHIQPNDLEYAHELGLASARSGPGASPRGVLGPARGRALGPAPARTLGPA